MTEQQQTKTEEIMREFERRLGEAGNAYQGRLAELRNDGAMPTDERTAAAWAAHRAYSEAYRTALERRDEALEAREAQLTDLSIGI